MAKRSLVLGFLACVLSSYTAWAGTLINGAGATFPYPLYSKWFTEYHKANPDTEINYQSIGSGGGIRQFTDKTVDFGATDAPMTDEQLAKVGQPVLHIPTCLGAVALAYHIPEGPKNLKLTGELIADIFLGKVKKWEDPRILALNKGATLSGDIMVIHRSDGSGTTSVFADYVSKVSPEFKEKVGTGTSVKWPVGLGGKGNEGVSGLVKQTPGSIGYVEFIYAVQNHLSYASIKNSAGEFSQPSIESVTSAAQSALKGMPSDYRISITNTSGKGVYPISSFTYLLVHKTQGDNSKGEKLVKFLKWAMVEGQTMTGPLHYAPLPKQLVSKVQSTIQSIEVKKLN